MNIDFRKLVLELSDESFEQLKEYCSPYTWSFFVKQDEVTRLMQLEKIGDYLRPFEASAKLRDADLAKKYVDVLLQYIDNRTVPAKKGETPCKAEKYFKRAKALQQKVSQCDDSDMLITILEDFSKIFLCMYSECMINIEKQITTLDFHVSKLDFGALTEFFLKDTPALSRIEQKAPDQLKKVIPSKFLKGADEVKKGLNDMQKGLQDAHKGLGDQLKKMLKSEDTIVEPVHDLLEYLEDHDIYNEKNFTVLLLTVFYLRIKDYELGLC